MKTRVFLLCAVVALALFPAPLLAADDDVTMNGSFVWDRDDKDIDGGLRAVFTPTGEDAWDVSFHFEWEDGPHVYAGTATGSLVDGTLEGEVKNDNPEREATFFFKGTFTDGAFRGSHRVLNSEGKERPTGSFTLSRS